MQEVEELNKVIQKHSNAPIIVWATSRDEMMNFLDETAKEMQRLFEDDSTLREKIIEHRQLKNELDNEKDDKKTEDLKYRMTKVTTEINELEKKGIKSQNEYKKKTIKVDEEVRFPFEKEMGKYNRLRSTRLDLMDGPVDPTILIELNNVAASSKNMLQNHFDEVPVLNFGAERERRSGCVCTTSEIYRSFEDALFRSHVYITCDLAFSHSKLTDCICFLKFIRHSSSRMVAISSTSCVSSVPTWMAGRRLCMPCAP